MKKWLVLFLLLASCTSSNDSSPPPKNNTSNGNNCGGTNAVSWQNGVSAVFQTNCVSCHAMYATYQSVTTNIAKIQSYIASGVMPKGRVMAAIDKTTIQTWVSVGMPQVSTTSLPANDCNQATPTPGYTPGQTPTPSVSSSVSYATTIAPIMQTYCLSCHAMRSPALDSYDRVKSNYYSVVNQVTSGYMPKGQTMPQDKIQAIQQWGTLGFAP